MNDICSRSAVELACLLRQGALSCVEVMHAHLAQIERLNPRLNAIVTLHADRALAAAERADRVPSAERAPLHGLPIAHKDLVLTRGMRTTMGSRVYEHHVPDQDDLIVERIRNAGAICIGKTNTPEFGAGSQTFNAVFGVTRNPWDPERTCGGSSGGAAVAVAARMLPIADGSDLGGSLRNPAAFCNVVGFRPTPGRVPAWPVRNPWFDMSVQGPIARTVDDAALLLAAMAGPDPRVPVALETSGIAFREVAPIDLRRVRVALTLDFGLPVEPEIRERITEIGRLLETLGARVTHAAPDLADARRIFHVFRANAFREKLGTLDAVHPDARRLVKETVRWNLEQGERLTTADLDWATAARARLVTRVAEFFQNHDVLLGPTTQVLPFPCEVEWVREIEGAALESYVDWMQSCSAITVTGCPAMSLPAGFSREGLPVGMQLVAPFRQDAWLLALAKSIEAATGFAHRAPPCAT